jgi:hypothetical protein
MTEAPPELVDDICDKARHLAKLALQRGGDVGGHHIRAGAGVQRGDLNGGVVHLGQGRDGQQPVSQQARDEQRHHHQRGGDGAQDEDARQVHDISIKTGLDALSKSFFAIKTADTKAVRLAVLLAALVFTFWATTHPPCASR